jgi:hypothetical protein
MKALRHNLPRLLLPSLLWVALLAAPANARPLLVLPREAVNLEKGAQRMYQRSQYIVYSGSRASRIIWLLAQQAYNIQSSGLRRCLPTAS